VKLLAPEFGRSACCRAFGVARSTACYRSRRSPQKVDLTRLKQTIQHELVSFGNYGVQHMYKHLQGLGISASRSSVRRAYLEMGKLRKHHRKRISTTNSRHCEPVHPNLVKGVQVVSPDHVWAADVTYLRVKKRFAYLALVMDICTREILGWSLSLTNDTELTLSALRKGLDQGRAPKIHHSDQGANYASKRYVAFVQANGAKMSMTLRGRPQDNGFVERLNRTVKEEEILRSEYLDLNEAHEALEAYVHKYNNCRIHSSLGYKKPSQVFKEWVETQLGGPP
jgi:putative transposase